jgi:hypothetical protein
MPYSADLEHHDADRMRNDVVQLASDSGTFLSDRDAGRGHALLFCPRRSFFGVLGLRVRVGAARGQRASRSRTSSE